MGMRLRLSRSFNCATLQPMARIVCVALQTYGGIVAGADLAFRPEYLRRT